MKNKNNSFLKCRKNMTPATTFAVSFAACASIAGCSSSQPRTSQSASEVTAHYEALMTKATHCGSDVLIVGHRGASGHTPEHTLHSYKLALEMGADYIEPDLVMTKDGVLIARHENEISETTNVAEKFPKRKTTKTIDGEVIAGWFTEDLTLSEIKSLRARERLAFRSHKEDGQYEIPTFEEILGFVKLQEKKRGKKIGIAPEIKHPTYFSEIRLPMEDKVVHLLNKYNLNQSDSKVMIQSFETENLKYLRPKVKVELVQLIDEKVKLPIDFGAIAKYAQWVSPHKQFIVPINAIGQIRSDFVSPSKFIEDAHAAGLKVLPYTFRSDENFLVKAYGGDNKKEYFMFFNLGIDGLFSDFSDHAVSAKAEYLEMCRLLKR